MKTKRTLARAVAAVMAARAVALAIGGTEATGFFKEAAPLTRSGPNGKPDIIKVPGQTKWGNPTPDPVKWA